ncbi:MarR family transcriptional regulator [Microbacterium sp. SSW1-47]|jgi:DNA-binding MarR family transcriptional regulator|uniref:MarR family winged helix-turn-helix transcriptional regulator n=1 Tax=Microbacterium TaxID=33882 RepID=UPI00109BC8B9|nr:MULTISPECIES: MarR family transcriptional regulator [Microbacterium]MCK2025062.1 MarR family transcriptional regulator [Microbacterium sufflavum]MPS75791.1 MarR family transcriptional regulator [Microbacterium sp.]
MIARTVSDLVVQLQLLTRSIEQQATAQLETQDTTLRTVSVLLCAAAGEKTQKELAELACLDKSTMVNTLDALERAGLAERRVLAEDRRVRIVEVTDRGHAIVSSTAGALDDLYSSLLDRLPEEDREPFLRSLSRLTQAPSPQPADAVAG